MNILENEKKLDKFIKQCYRSWYVKYSVLLVGLWTLCLYSFKEVTDIVDSLLIIILLNIVANFIFPNLLFNETKRAINRFCDNKYQNKNEIIICNLHKITGPTIGVLEVSSNEIKLTPLKNNLKYEGVLINKDNMKNIRIILFNMKWSILNRLFFRELYQAIKVSSDNLSIIIQTVEPQSVIKKLNKEMR